MDLLLDTSIFLWYISGEDRLTEKHLNLIRDNRNEVFLSVVSFWEIIIKQDLGKLELPGPAAQYIPDKRIRHNISSLALDEQSIKLLQGLSLLHKDPFDRMLICQSQAHNIKLLTSDEAIIRYGFSNII
jgi:PIN domain nuclease of toxin-antitoxin system